MLQRVTRQKTCPVRTLEAWLAASGIRYGPVFCRVTRWSTVEAGRALSGEAVRQIEYLANPGVGELRIGCPDIMNAGVMPPLVDRFLRRWPEVRLHVVYADTGAGQFQLLRERRVDLLRQRVLHAA